MGPLQQERAHIDGMFECVIHPGEVLYFPDQWEHGTINRGAFNFFVSYFIDINLLPKSDRFI